MSFVVASGSKQYIVELGQQFAVDSLTDTQEGDVLEFPLVFAFGGDKGKKTVKVKVIGHAQGDKIRVVKYRSKSNYHVQSGFRAQQTVLEVVSDDAKTENKKIITEEVKTEEIAKKAATKKPSTKEVK